MSVGQAIHLYPTLVSVPSSGFGALWPTGTTMIHTKFEVSRPSVICSRVLQNCCRLPADYDYLEMFNAKFEISRSKEEEEKKKEIVTRVTYIAGLGPANYCAGGPHMEPV